MALWARLRGRAAGGIGGCRQAQPWRLRTQRLAPTRGFSDDVAKMKTVSDHLSTVWHFRENWVMRRHQKLHRVALAVGHVGYILGLLEYGVTDIILLRLFAIAGCGMVVGFQLLQPRVQWISAGWCAIYSAVNVVQLASLYTVAEPELSWEEAKLHAFYADQISTSQFYALMEVGEWLWLVDGAILAEEGESSDDSAVTFITEGSCRVSVRGRDVAELGPGSVVGELGALGETGASCTGAGGAGSAAVVAAGSVRCFSAPRRRLAALLEEQPELRRPLQRVFGGALAAKVAAMNDQVLVRNYRAVLEVACALDEHVGIGEGLERYRQRHGVSEDVHLRLLDEVPQCVHRPFRTLPPLAGGAAGPPSGGEGP